MVNTTCTTAQLLDYYAALGISLIFWQFYHVDDVKRPRGSKKYIKQANGIVFQVSIIEPGNFIAGTNLFTSKSVKEIRDDLWDRTPDQVKEDYGKDAFEKGVSQWIHCLILLQQLLLLFNCFNKWRIFSTLLFKTNWYKKLNFWRRLVVRSLIGEHVRKPRTVKRKRDNLLNPG